MSDAAALAAAFDGALRAQGVVAGARRALTFAEVLHALPPRSTADLYWRARAAMLPSIDDLERFHAAFVRCFAPGDDDALRRLTESVPAPPPLPEDAARRPSLPPAPSEDRAQGEDARRAPEQWVLAASDERLAERDFEALSADEQAAILRLISRVRVAAEARESRRRRASRGGDRFDFRGTLRGAARTHGELLRRRATARRHTLRPLVFLLDVSGSMEPFARALLQYARVNAIARPRVRAFAFATRLTDLAPSLRRADDRRLMATLAQTIRDFGGGTRIGAALRAFNDGYAQRGLARGGTVVILSDGWEREDPELVRREMERLRRLTRRIVWVNPHKRHPAYEPLARGMAAALPYLDAFVSGHNVRTLDAVADAIEGRTTV
ncbi:MAG TPA: VWA domain-containing protein [Candidatus Sulfotelmatobacter sp.]|nr:VWA domain-containing protein [Candidatus Sulfotelmatobacter sp.]